MISYELPPNLFYYWVTWQNYYEDYTWEQFENTWNT